LPSTTQTDARTTPAGPPRPDTPPGAGSGSAPPATGAGPARLVPGLALVLVIAVCAFLLGRLVPVVGGPVFGIVIGMVVAAAHPLARPLRPGIAFAGKQLLQAAIVLLGTGLSLLQIVHTGAGSLPVMLGTMAACLLGAWLFGRLLRVSGDLQALIGVGTGICGASAIAAASTVLGAAETDIAYSVSTIFLFNVIAVLLYPTLGHLLHFTQSAFGLWAGTAINDTSSVVAAGYTFGAAAGNFAVIVKLTRTTLIIPITLALAGWKVLRLRADARAVDGGTAPTIRWRRIIPWFILWFILAALLNTLGIFSRATVHGLAQLAVFLIVMALSAIGLSANFGQMRKTGTRPLVLGMILWATVGLSSIGLQHLTGQW